MLYSAEPFVTISGTAGLKKFVSATAVADVGDAQALVRSSGAGFEVGSVRLVNRSGSLATVGLGVRFRTDSWVAGQVTAAGVYTDATPAAQDATAGDFTLWQRGIATGNGYLVGASERFNTLALIQSVAGDQTTPVLKLEYWNGTAWTDLTAALTVTQALLASGTGEKLLVWGMPADWARGGSGTGVPQTTYNVRVTHTVATGGTADPTAAQVFVGQSQLVFPDVANGGQGTFAYNAAVRFSKLGTALFPVFSVASFGNIVELQYRVYV